jgi:hypothetical protein
VEVIIFPAHDNLQGAVQLSRGRILPDREPPPDRRMNVPQRHLELMLCFLIFMDNLLRWMERGGNSAWFWLCSGKLEVVFLFGLFSLVAQFLYRSEIVGDLNEQQAERRRPV